MESIRVDIDNTVEEKEQKSYELYLKYKGRRAIVDNDIEGIVVGYEGEVVLQGWLIIKVLSASKEAQKKLFKELKKGDFVFEDKDIENNYYYIRESEIIEE